MSIQVDFYILSTESGSSEDYAVRFIDKVYRKGLSVKILAADKQAAQRLDDKLWIHDGFIPHTVQTSPDGDMISICIRDTLSGAADVLLNLAGEIPPTLEGFQRIAEIVPAAEEARDQSRRNYRRYQEHGYAIKTHQIGAQAR